MINETVRNNTYKGYATHSPPPIHPLPSHQPTSPLCSLPSLILHLLLNRLCLLTILNSKCPNKTNFIKGMYTSVYSDSYRLKLDINNSVIVSLFPDHGDSNTWNGMTWLSAFYQIGEIQHLLLYRICICTHFCISAHIIPCNLSLKMNCPK